jgi:hypothetical protein
MVRGNSVAARIAAVGFVLATFPRGVVACAGDNFETVVAALFLWCDFFGDRLRPTALTRALLLVDGIDFTVGCDGIGAVTATSPETDRAHRSMQEPNKFAAVLASFWAGATLLLA